MPRSYQKNILRTFRSTKSRFIAIFSIVALGVGFLAGLMSTTPDMKESMEVYLDGANFYDLRVVSTLGLTEDDVAALEAVEGVERVQPGYSLDLLVSIGEDTLVARAQSLPAGDPEDPQVINRLTLEEGRWPAAPGECVVEGGVNALRASALQVGDTFTASPENEDLSDSLARTQFTVVGKVRNANYFSIEREPASVGDGSVAVMFYLLPQDFAYEVYTEAYLTVAGAAPLASLDEEYEDAVEDVADRVEAIKADRANARYREVVDDARAELDDGWQEYNDARAEADEEFAKAEQELADGRQELADGEKEYADGEKELADAEKELADGKKEYADGVQELADAERRLAEAQAQYDEGWAQIEEGQHQIDEALRQLQDGQAQYEAGMAEYQSGKAQYDAGLEQVAGLEQLAENLPVYRSALQALAHRLGQNTETVEQQLPGLLAGAQADLAQKQLAAEPFLTAYQALETAKAELEAAKTAGEGQDVILQKEAAVTEAEQAFKKAAMDFYPGEEETAALAKAQAAINDYNASMQNVSELVQLMAMKTGLDQACEALAALPQMQEQGLTDAASVRGEILNASSGDAFLQAIIKEIKAQLAASESELAAAEAELAAAKATLDAGWAELEEQSAVFYQAKRELEAAKQQLDDGYAELARGRAELADAAREIADGEKEIADGKKELADAWQEILDGRQELADGEAEYAEEKADAEAELADALAELEDGEAELADLEPPEWYVWDRGRNTSFNSFKGNVSKVEAIARVFPIFFFLVAALVVSTTMTRMVEEERLQIGTMKAMGYERRDIMKKYIWYALTAAVFGALSGLALGFVVFPSVIWYAYEMMYYMPHLSTPWRANYAVMAGGLLIGCALITTLSACQATLRETPADLMRPRAPRAGKRIFLERIGPLWRRLPFTYKVTCRNLLRYKRRFWMTVIGVAGCTALLVTGFGISDSLNGIAIKQYGEIYKYDLLTAVTDTEYTQSGAIHDYLFTDPAFAGSLAASTELVSQTMPDGSANEVYLMTPQDAAAFADFADLHERISRKPTPLTDDGLILTEKLAETWGVEAGDTVTLENGDGEKAMFNVTGVCEHYVMNYAYIGPAAYERAFGHAPEWNAVLTLLTDDSAAARADISAKLLGMEGIGAVNFTTDQMDAVLNMLNSINAVVVLIIVCAASLAFVVLYNLTNINIAERVKEIATIKVLGFYDREVAAYVNRESVALTVIGALLGLLGGIALHKFVIYTVEVDAVMFGRDIEPVSFVYALALTMLFSTMVNLVMGRKLKKISMVESMKAPE